MGKLRLENPLYTSTHVRNCDAFCSFAVLHTLIRDVFCVLQFFQCFTNIVRVASHKKVTTLPESSALVTRPGRYDSERHFFNS